MMRIVRNILLFSLWLSCSISPPIEPVESPSSQDPSSPVYAEQLARNNQPVHYSGQFEYTLSDCEGPHSKDLNEFVKRSFFQATVQRNKVKFLRPDKKSEMNVAIESHWNSTTRKLSRSRGRFGMAETEDWRNSTGIMNLSRDEISGQITDIDIIHQQTFCGVLFRFRGVAAQQSSGVPDDV